MKNENRENIVHIKPVVVAEQGHSGNVTEIKIQKQEKTLQQKLTMYGIVTLVILLMGYAQLKVGLRTEMKILKIHNSEGANNNRFQVFGKNCLRYGKDGMALLDSDMEEKWNAAYQISNPIVAMQGNSLAVGDRNGNQIIVADTNGVKGKIYTSLPIEKISVSNQGIVLAQVKDSTSSQIICYDSIGNILMEHQVSVNVLGYPLDSAISYDGKMIMVTYLQYKDGELVGNYVCYSLDNTEATGEERIVTQGKLPGVVLPSTYFLDKNKAVVIGDDRVLFVDVVANADTKEVLLDSEIASVSYSEKYIALCAKSNDGLNESRLLVYNSNGSMLCDVTFEGSYTEIVIVDNIVMLYESETCKIYSVNGTEVFDGEFSNEIVDMFPVDIFNKYLIIGKDNIVDVRLKR